MLHTTSFPKEDIPETRKHGLETKDEMTHIERTINTSFKTVRPNTGQVWYNGISDQFNLGVGKKLQYNGSQSYVKANKHSLFLCDNDTF